MGAPERGEGEGRGSRVSDSGRTRLIRRIPPVVAWRGVARRPAQLAPLLEWAVSGTALEEA